MRQQTNSMSKHKCFCVNKNTLQDILNAYPDEQFLIADGFNEAVIGLECDSGRLVYSIPKCIDILMHKHNMEYDEAIEFFQYNVSGSFVGEKTPIWVNNNF